ncbi:MAG: hypothetical protein ABI602_03125 [Candidatus Saccharibacteria bacterium]
MDIELGKGITMAVNPAEQSDEWLLKAAAEFEAAGQEIQRAAAQRGLRLPHAAGGLALHRALQADSQFAPASKEALDFPLGPSYQAYKSIIDRLNKARARQYKIKPASLDGLESEFADWFSAPRQAYIQATQEADPQRRYTLVATPNVQAHRHEVRQSALDFGKKQPHESLVNDELLSKYQHRQLAGGRSSDKRAFLFSLIPTTYTPGLEGPVLAQRSKFDELQATHPQLRVPSPFEAITFWATLRAQGDTLDNGDVYARTSIVHFDLPEQRSAEWLCVPHSYIDNRGVPHLGYLSVDFTSNGRLAIG